MAQCIVCDEKVNWEDVVEEFKDTLNRADSHGVESLTEQEQHVYEGRICNTECYEELP